MLLAVRGDEALLRQLGRRLRGATVQPLPPDDTPPDGCDAVVLLDRRAGDAALIGRCLEAGHHTLLVAQPWLAGAALDRLADAASRSGAQLAILNPDRYLPSRQLLRQQLDSGRLGEPGLVRSHQWEPAPDTAGQESAENAPDLDAAVAAPLARALDVALWLMGGPPTVVHAVIPGIAGEASGDDAPARRSMQVHLGFAGGGMALIDYVSDLPPGDGYQSLTLIGSTGAAYADDHQNVQLVYGGGHPAAVNAGEGERELVALVQDFVACLNQVAGPGAAPTGGSAAPSGTAEWRAAMAVADAARRSAAENQAVALKGN